MTSAWKGLQTKAFSQLALKWRLVLLWVWLNNSCEEHETCPGLPTPRGGRAGRRSAGFEEALAGLQRPEGQYPQTQPPKSICPSQEKAPAGCSADAVKGRVKEQPLPAFRGTGRGPGQPGCTRPPRGADKPSSHDVAGPGRAGPGPCSPCPLLLRALRLRDAGRLRPALEEPRGAGAVAVAVAAAAGGCPGRRWAGGSGLRALRDGGAGARSRARDRGEQGQDPALRAGRELGCP